MSMTARAYQIPEEEFIKIVKNSTSCADAMRAMGYVCTTGGGYLIVKRRATELHLDLSHWADNTKNARIATKIPTEQYFVKDTPRNGTHTRKRLVQDKLIPYQCAICGNKGEWNNQPLILQVDHINGDHNDNRLENLRFLCPNCHAQTDTFAGKNLKKNKE